MRHLIIATAAVAVTLVMVPASFAQSRDKPNCPPNQQTCVQDDIGRPGSQPQPQPQHDARKHGKVAETRHKVPRIGDNGRGGQNFHRAQNSRFKAPPRGQEYRVVNEHLVLVDSKTLRIVTVVGLLSALLN